MGVECLHASRASRVRHFWAQIHSPARLDASCVGDHFSLGSSASPPPRFPLPAVASTTKTPRRTQAYTDRPAPGAQAASSPVENRFLPALVLLFIGSGCAALIYEIVWFQLLSLIVGSSAVSLGVLLGTFMGGMCIGSLFLSTLHLAPPASAARLRDARGGDCGLRPARPLGPAVRRRVVLRDRASTA